MLLKEFFLIIYRPENKYNVFKKLHMNVKLFGKARTIKETNLNKITINKGNI